MKGNLTRHPDPFPDRLDEVTMPDEIRAHARMVHHSDQIRARRGMLQRIDGYWTPLLVRVGASPNPWTPGLG